MINNSVSGYKNEGAKNITNANPTTAGGGGTFNNIANIGTGDSLLINNDPTITAKTLLAGSGISITDTGNELQIINTLSPGAESYGYYKTDFCRFVSVSHPNADQPGTNVFTTIQLAMDNIVASGAPIDTNFNILVEQTSGMESPNIACPYNINMWFLGNFTLSTLTFDLQNNNTFNITAPNGIVTFDSIINNSSSAVPVLRLTNVIVTTEITDNSANGELHVEGCTLGKFTVKQLKHCNNMILTSNLSLATSADSITNSEFYQALDIATFSDPYSGFKNCFFKGVAKTFNGAALQLDSNSLYSFNANSWTNLSGITTILEVTDGVSTLTAGNGLSNTGTATDPIFGISAPVSVANGGTNSTTALNSNRIMVSSAGAIREAAALTDGQLLIGSTGVAPVAANLTAGSNISISNASGSVTISATGITGGTVTSVDGSGSTTGLTLTGGPITSSGTLTLGGVLNGANGGTGNSSYAIGDLLYANTATTLAKLPDVAAGSFLRSGGVGVAPNWSTVTIPNTVSANRLLVTNANAIVTTNALTNGQLLIGSTGASPLLGTLTAGAGITITNGAGSITIATNGTGLPSFKGQTNGTATVSTTLPASPGTAFHAYTIPANTLNTAGDSIIFEWHSSQVETVASTLGGYLVNLGTMSPSSLNCATGFTNSGIDRFDHIIVTITRYSPSAMSVRAEAFLGVGTSSATASGCRSSGAVGSANWAIAQTISLGMYNSGTGTLNGRVYCSSVKYYIQ